MQISSSGISAQGANDKIVCAADYNLLEKSPAPKGCRAWCSDKLLVQAEALVELGHTAAGVHQLLSARKERVTLRADFYANILLRRTCLNYITAGAFNSSLLIIGMDSFLHCSGSPLSGTLVVWAFTHKRNCDNTTACGKLQALFYNFTVEFVWKKYRSFSDTSFSSTLPSASA